MLWKGLRPYNHTTSERERAFDIITGVDIIWTGHNMSAAFITVYFLSWVKYFNISIIIKICIRYVFMILLTLKRNYFHDVKEIGLLKIQRSYYVQFIICPPVYITHSSMYSILSLNVFVCCFLYEWIDLYIIFSLHCTKVFKRHFLLNNHFLALFSSSFH